MTMFYCPHCDCFCNPCDPCDCESRMRDEQERAALQTQFSECDDARSYIAKLKEAWLMGAPVSQLVRCGI